MIKLNLGCGSQVIEGWVNVDYALGARLAKLPVFGRVNPVLRVTRLDWHPRIVIHDLRKPLPWPDAAAGEIYTSHTLEHLDKGEGLALLKECHRVLAPGGLLRIVVPDLRHHVAKYIAGSILADDFVEGLGVLRGGGRKGLKAVVGSCFQYPHLCMYDAPRLLEILDEVGFVSTERRGFESDIEDVRLLELEERTVNAVIVEGRKR